MTLRRRKPMRRTRKPIKRSALRRKAPLPKRRDRMRAVRKGGRRGGDRAVVEQWKAEHPACFFCGREAGYGLVIDAHHAVNGKHGRPDDVRALVSACRVVIYLPDLPSCHDLCEGVRRRRTDGTLWPKITLANVLWAKREMDPSNFDPDWLAKVRRRALPELVPVPEILRTR